MKYSLLLSCFLLTSLTITTSAHNINYSVTFGNAVVVELSYPDNTKFSYESYELFRPGDDIPFQVGRTDSLGRIVFIPDQSGSWRLRAFSEDGHGIDFTVDVDAENHTIGANTTHLNQFSKTLIGIGILFGIFGILSFALRRRGA